MYQLLAYLKYLLHSKNEHGVHSPFVFEILKNVIHGKKDFYAFDEIAFIKKKLLAQNISIQQVEYGAGSKGKIEQKKSINKLIKQVSMPEQQGKWLFKIIQQFQPKNILELGTCIGIGTLYMALENKNRPVFTLEGNPDSAKIANSVFEQLQLKNIKIFEGTFENNLSKVLAEMAIVDFAFIDGNHRYEPTMNYYNKILPFTNEDSILIFHDIHWSKEMEKAWNELCNQVEITISVDLFFMGIVFFRKGIIKQHFVLR